MEKIELLVEKLGLNDLEKITPFKKLADKL